MHVFIKAKFHLYAISIHMSYFTVAKYKDYTVISTYRVIITTDLRDVCLCFKNTFQTLLNLLNDNFVIKKKLRTVRFHLFFFIYFILN